MPNFKHYIHMILFLHQNTNLLMRKLHTCWMTGFMSDSQMVSLRALPITGASGRGKRRQQCSRLRIPWELSGRLLILHHCILSIYYSAWPIVNAPHVSFGTDMVVLKSVNLRKKKINFPSAVLILFIHIMLDRKTSLQTTGNSVGLWFENFFSFKFNK